MSNGCTRRHDEQWLHPSLPRPGEQWLHPSSRRPDDRPAHTAAPGAKEMGSSASNCEHDSYPGYDDFYTPKCMPRGWIVAPVARGHAIPSEVEQVYHRCLNNVHDRTRRTASSVDTAWMLTRWCAMDQDATYQDTISRVVFVELWFHHTRRFITDNEAWLQVNAKPSEAVVTLDRTVPGQVNFHRMSKDRTYETKAVSIGQRWSRTQTLESLCDEVFNDGVLHRIR